MNNSIKKIIKNKDKDELRKNIIRANYAKKANVPANIKNVRPINNGDDDEKTEPIINKPIAKNEKAKKKVKINDDIKDERKIKKATIKKSEPQKLEVNKKQMDQLEFLKDEPTSSALLQFANLVKSLGV